MLQGTEKRLVSVVRTKQSSWVSFLTLLTTGYQTPTNHPLIHVLRLLFCMNKSLDDPCLSFHIVMLYD